jgi:hypothetical protein
MVATWYRLLFPSTRPARRAPFSDKELAKYTRALRRLRARTNHELARMLARELAGEELSARRLADRVVGDVGAFRAMAVALLASGRVSGADGARYVIRALRTVDAAQAAMPTVERAVSSFCAVRL